MVCEREMEPKMHGGKPRKSLYPFTPVSSTASGLRYPDISENECVNAYSFTKVFIAHRCYTYTTLRLMTDEDEESFAYRRSGEHCQRPLAAFKVASSSNEVRTANP